jgi:hypothetical protein
MTLKGLSVQQFNTKPNTELESLNIGDDARERLHMMKMVLLGRQAQWGRVT